MTNVSIDAVGSVSKEWLLSDFVKYYEANKESLDKIHSHTLNTHVSIHDEYGNKYKVIRRQGKTILKRVAENDCMCKRDIITQLHQLRGMLENLEKLVNKKDSEQEDDDDDGTNSLIATIQNKKPLKKYPI